MKRLAKTALILLLALALAMPAWAAAPAESRVYYAQLSTLSQSIYDAFVDLGFADGTITFNGPFDNPQQTADQIIAAEPAAVAALELEHPELFWVTGANCNISGNSAKLVMTMTWKSGYNWAQGGRSLQSDAAALTDAVQKLANEARAQGGQYEQLLYVHDWLTTHNTYNVAAPAAGIAFDYLPWTPLSALTDVSQPVCEGYSKAFKLVCDELGIPCILVDGTGSGDKHEWNYVQMDGQWYAVDVTYDDPIVVGTYGNQSGYEKHEYFLVGSEKLFTNHTPGGAHVDDVVLNVPTLSYYDYQAGSAYPSDTPADPDEPGDPDWPDEPGDVDEPGKDAEPEPIRFVDVPEDAYYAPAVQWAVTVGVTNGTDLVKKLFSPGDTVKRGQSVTFLWRAMGEPEPETQENPFADVKETDYFYKAVLWAVENGITNGTKLNDENGLSWFSPNDDVTRGQMLTFLWRTVGRPGETGAGPWYGDAERWAQEFGLAEGTAEAYTTGGRCPRSDVVYYLYHAVLSMAG